MTSPTPTPNPTPSLSWSAVFTTILTALANPQFWSAILTAVGIAWMTWGKYLPWLAAVDQIVPIILQGVGITGVLVFHVASTQPKLNAYRVILRAGRYSAPGTWRNGVQVSLIILIGGASLALFLPGCAQTSRGMVIQQAITDQAASDATVALTQGGTITIADAKAVYIAAMTYRGAIGGEYAAIITGDSTGLATAESAAAGALANLQAALKNVQSKTAWKLDDGKLKDAVSPGDISAIIQAIEDAIAFAQQSIASANPTDTDVQSSLASLDSSLARLQAVVSPPITEKR